VFAVFQMFFMLGLVIYYMCQTVLRIGQQAYITRRFYGHDESLGRQAQRAGETARAEAAKRGETGGLFAQAKRDLTGGGKGGDTKSDGSSKSAKPAPKRVTPPKGRPPSAAQGKGRPTPSRKDAQTNRAKPKSTRPKSSGRKRR
jgi:YidC/Oxa1 family membrane protein insertase